MKVLRHLCLVGAILGTSGCALTSKADALSVRWFSPENAKARITSADASSPAAKEGLTLELGRITSGLNLREKIAYRDAAFELGYYDDKRWTERPEVYVRRELARTLFEERGIKRALAGQAPVLEIEVISFEELRGSPTAARVQLRIIVHDDVTSLLEKTVTVDRPVPAGAKGFEGLVQAMALALDATAEEVASDVEKALAKPRSP